MLASIEKFLTSIRSIDSNASARRVISGISRHFGFRSGFLIAYSDAPLSVLTLIDSSLEREAAWPGLFAERGLEPGVGGIVKMLAMNVVVKLPEDRFLPNHPYRDFAAAYDLQQSIAVPIGVQTDVTGMVAYSGYPALSHEDQRALQLLSYSLFVEARKIAIAGAPDRPLTPRETEIMELSAAGLTSEAIAARLGISARTVNEHIDRVGTKLGTINRVHAVAEVIRRGLIQ